jgi:hypothetical protein
MGINKAKHIVGEIEGIRCSVIESEITLERAAFLRQLLEFNNYEVKEQVVENPESGQIYTIGVTDIVFNPVYAIYECLLKTPEGGHVTPGYWLQECIECDPRYWLRRRKLKK